MEWRHRSRFLPILAAYCRFMGAVGIGARWIVRLGVIGREVALGDSPPATSLCGGGSRDFRFRLYRSKRRRGVD